MKSRARAKAGGRIDLIAQRAHDANTKGRAWV